MRHVRTVIFIFSVILFFADADIDHRKRGKSHSIHARHKVGAHHLIGHRKSGLKYRDGYGSHQNNTQCVCDEPNSGSPNLTIFYNGPAGLVGAVNLSSNIGWILDYLDDIPLLLNGQTGVAILGDNNSNVVYQLNETWIESKEKFSQFFQNLPSLKPLLEVARRKGGGSTLNNPSSVIEAEIIRDEKNLLGSHKPAELTTYGKAIIAQLKGPLKELYKGKGFFEIHIDLVTFLKLNIALGDILANADDLHSIGPLDLGYIFSAKNGLGTLINFLEEIGKGADLTKIFGTLLKSYSKFFHLVTKVESAVSHQGVDGFDAALINIALALQGNGSLSDVISSVFSYVPNHEVNPTVINGYRKQILAILETQFKKYNNYDRLSWWYNSLIAETNNSLVIFNVNITDVENLLYFRSVSEVLRSGVRIFMGIFSSENIPRLIQLALDNKIVQQIISYFFPSLSGKILTTSDLMSYVSHLPVIGSILPRIFEFGSNITRTVGHNFRAVVDEISNGSLGVASENLFREIGGNVRNFVSGVLDHFGFNFENPLSASFNGLIGAGEGIIETASNGGGKLLGINSKNKAHVRPHQSRKGKGHLS